MDYLPSYIFPKHERLITDNLALGISLGGHATWSCALHEPRIRSAIIVIGCPDYVNLMADRARLSKHPSWTSTEGSQFLGSEAFPKSLVETVHKYDPTSLFLSFTSIPTNASIENGGSFIPLRNGPLPEPSESEKNALRPLLTKCLAGKRILNLAGGSDKLVPYHRGESFLTWLKKAVAPDGWFGDGAVTLEDIIDQEAGHEMTPKMTAEAVRFIIEAQVVPIDGQNTVGFVRELKL